MSIMIDDGFCHEVGMSNKMYSMRWAIHAILWGAHCDNQKVLHNDHKLYVEDEIRMRKLTLSEILEGMNVLEREGVIKQNGFPEKINYGAIRFEAIKPPFSNYTEPWIK